MSFSSRVIAWQQRYGRHGLPWQGGDAYRVWVSEIMLQQTQVAAVIPYYQRFMARFPAPAVLAAAHEDEVLAHWSGLGYYTRARNLHRAAQQIVAQYGGAFPDDFDAILALPGIGRSTAAAISAFAFGQRRAILDGNVKRVLARHQAIAGWPGDKRVESQLWQAAEALLPPSGVEAYTQGLMDLGALVCTRSKPRCGICPVAEDCRARLEDRVAAFPAPRPRKTLPERETVFLLLQSEQGIVLEKRPAQGIWGGLWSLPEFAAEAEALQASAAAGLQLISHERLPGFSHTFTHFRLHLAPLHGRVQSAGNALPVGWRWFSVQAALEAGIPAPVRRILEGLPT